MPINELFPIFSIYKPISRKNIFSFRFYQLKMLLQRILYIFAFQIKIDYNSTNLKMDEDEE